MGNCNISLHFLNCLINKIRFESSLDPSFINGLVVYFGNGFMKKQGLVFKMHYGIIKGKIDIIMTKQIYMGGSRNG